MEDTSPRIQEGRTDITLFQTLALEIFITKLIIYVHSPKQEKCKREQSTFLLPATAPAKQDIS